MQPRVMALEKKQTYRKVNTGKTKGCWQNYAKKIYSGVCYALNKTMNLCNQCLSKG